MLKNLCWKNEKYRPNLKCWKSTYFSWKCSPLEIQNTFLTTKLEILSPKSKKISHKLRKNRRTILQKRYFAQKYPLDIYYALLITLPRIFLRNWEFFAQNPTKLHFFPEELVFLQSVVPASTMQIWQSSRIFDWQLRETFLPKTRI